MNRSYKYSLFLVGTVCKIYLYIKGKNAVAFAYCIHYYEVTSFSGDSLKCKWYISLMG